MKVLSTLIFSLLVFSQSSNQDLFLNLDWQLNFVEDSNQNVIYTDTSVIYDLNITNFGNGNYQMTIPLYSGMSVDFNFATDGAFNKINTNCLCAGPPCEQLTNPPVNHCLIDNFYNNFYSIQNNNYTYVLTDLSNNNYSLDIYNAFQQRLNFNNVNLSNDNFLHSQVKIYPNPAKDFIEISSNLSFDTIEIFNSLGVKIGQSQFINSIDVSHLSQGIYFVTLKSTLNESVTIKFIKQ